MSAEFPAVFAALRPVLAKYVKHLAVKSDTAADYSLDTKVVSPFPQHKGHPMWFGAVKLGKAYVSYHLMPLYMNPALEGAIDPALKKRMQGKTCFNFKTVPDEESLAALDRLTGQALEQWRKQKWA
jgi:hypothetical protein